MKKMHGAEQMLLCFKMKSAGPNHIDKDSLKSLKMIIFNN